MICKYWAKLTGAEQLPLVLTVLGRKKIRGLRGEAGSLMLSQQMASPQRGLELLMGCDLPLGATSGCPTSTSNQAGLWNYPVASSLPLWEQLKAALWFGLHSESIPLLLRPQGPPHTTSSLPCLCFPVCPSLSTSGFDYSSVVLLCGGDPFLPHF